MAIHVDFATTEDYAAWDGFVAQHPEGTFCHRFGWQRVIENGAGQKCPYLIARKNGVVVGVLPLTVKRHFIFGKALISNMFCVYGGALASDASTLELLYNRAWQIAQSAGINVFENRTVSAQHSDTVGWQSRTQSATFICDLAEDPEQQLLAIPRKQRAVIRKSLKHELTTQWNGNIDIFYDLYARSVLGLGTPVFPKKMFSLMAEVFKGAIEVQITHDPQGIPVASLLSFYSDDTVLPYYAGGTAAARALAAHDFMYYQLMCRAREKGKTRFDFGRSKVDSGPYRFKKNWGFEPIPLEYEWRLGEGATLPEISQQSGAFATFSKLWKKLPLPISKLLGPPLARHLG
jgi:FemAB-related protein (PEP-CTERM system-associated)